MHCRRLTLLALLSLALPSASLAQEHPGDARPWEHETSDIPVDPRIRFGRLENGLRYAWVANGEPRERCYVRLHVDVGSLAETDAENGMAHFLEHMAFNGSEHFEPGTLIEWFQEHGMDFGADTNAHTVFSETIYELDLPTSDEDTLRSGLQVLRDFAGGLTLDPEEVEAEKGVIDGEERERDSAGYRTFVETLRTLYDGTRIPERLIIGTKATRDAFTTETVRAFYEKWYRPELMTIVMVGDLGELDPAPMIAEVFADLPVPESDPPHEPPLGKPTLSRPFFQVHEPEIARATLGLSRLRPYEDEPATVANELEELPIGMARAMLNLRLHEIAKREGTPFLSARVGEAGGFEVFDGESLAVTCEPPKWKEALAAADDELRRALRFGFQQAELDEVRADFQRSLDEAVEREPTRHSRAILGEILRACEERSVPTNATTDRAFVAPALAELTVEACHAALVEGWSKGTLSLDATGGLDLGAQAADVLSATLSEIRSRPVEKGAEVATQTFAYASDPERTGAVASREEVGDLAFTRVAFENGVRLAVKRTDFKQRQILVQARLSEGGLTLDPARYALQWAGGAVVDGGGLGAHDQDALRRLLAGRQAGFGFSITADAFLFGGATTEEDLVLELELLAAYLSDPGWREEGLRELKDRLPTVYEELAHRPQGPLALEFLPALHGGDPRFGGIPPREAVEAVTVDAVREWLAPQFENGPLEVTIVGDVDVEAAIAAAARTVALLPKRRALEPCTERRKAPPLRSGLAMRRTIETKVPNALVYMAVPTTDGMQTARRRLLGFLGNQVVSDRLRRIVREELGAAYAPGAFADSSEVFPGIGSIAIVANAEPSAVEELLAACRRVLGELHEEGVPADEVARLDEPLLAKLRDAKRTNPFWLEQLSLSHRDPSRLDDIRDAETFFQSLSAEAVSALAKEYLDPERASLLVVTPKEASTD